MDSDREHRYFKLKGTYKGTRMEQERLSKTEHQGLFSLKREQKTFIFEKKKQHVD